MIALIHNRIEKTKIGNSSHFTFWWNLVCAGSKLFGECRSRWDIFARDIFFFLTVNDAVTLLRTTTDGGDDSTDRRFARLRIMLNTRKWLFKWNIYIYVVNVASNGRRSPADDRPVERQERRRIKCNFRPTEACITNWRTSLYLETACDVMHVARGQDAISSHGRFTIRLLCLHNVDCPLSLFLSLPPPVLCVSTYSTTYNTTDESGASGISKRMQFKKEQ